MSEYRFIENGSVSTPKGFLASGFTAGFKKSGAPDVALIYSATPCTFAGAFTSCVFAAAPVQLCKTRALSSPHVRAFFFNSGNANACTGPDGLRNAEKTCSIVADALKIAPEEVLVASTGRIGVQMPMEIIERGVRGAAAALDRDGGISAAHGIMTTDTVPKYAAIELEINGRTVRLGAMTKGAGMIDPAMKVLHATTLSCLTTDVKMDKAALAALWEPVMQESFNRITVDGDMSTNDTSIIMANGESGVEIRPGTPDFAAFQEACTVLMQKLAREMVVDGEGATKLVTVKVVNAESAADAKTLAESVANSLLCKTAWFGGDPNWGRVVAALGYSGVEFDPDLVDIFYEGIPVVRHGGDAGTPESELVAAVRQREFTVLVDMGAGSAEYWVWTCDISHEYVNINADYHT